MAGGKAMKLVVMSPLELGEKLTELEIKDDWTVGLGRPGEEFMGKIFTGDPHSWRYENSYF